MDVDYSTVGRLLANPARSQMLGLLLDGGGPRTASYLAQRAGVAPSTASEHLRDLVAGGLLVAETRGRHRYYELSSVEVAEALEALAQVCPPMEVCSLRASSQARRLRVARTCYDHLAGLLGVAVLDAIVSLGWLERADQAYAPGPGSQNGFSRLDINLEEIRHSRRPMIRTCLDWTARRPHLGGGLGAALCSSLFDRGWVTRAEWGRGLVVTGAGQRGLDRVLGIAAQDLVDGS
jgi:DNA-binding transcriptional ArsR family regulator